MDLKDFVLKVCIFYMMVGVTLVHSDAIDKGEDEWFGELVSDLELLDPANDVGDDGDVDMSTLMKCLKKCPPRDCKISIPINTEPKRCTMIREKSILGNRLFYKLTRYGEPHVIRFALKKIPFLNQTITAVEFHTALDEIDSRWAILLKTFKTVTTKTLQGLAKGFAKAPFTNLSDYVAIYKAHNQVISEKFPRMWSNPATQPTFTDLTHMQILSDDIFVQKRFAGPCPFLLKAITGDGKVGHHWPTIKSLLNPNFNFDAALRKAIGECVTMEKAVARNILYALYFRENNDMDTHPDFYDPLNDGLLNVSSPIAIFARTKSGELKAVAIQMDYESSADVFTPESNEHLWNIAKARVNMGDHNLCQAKWHLSHLHLSAGVYCVLFRSHFDSLHPIQQIMKHHCQGTVPHIALSYGALTDPGSHGHKIFSIGHKGYIKLLSEAMTQFDYDTLDLRHLMTSHGLDSNELKYYPFRDDGHVILNGFERFAKDFTDEFYHNDCAVEGDKELQSFARQVSNGGGSGELYGGKGNIVGFPTAFQTKKEVQTFVTRFLWQIAMHASVNYPLEPWGTLIPLSPGKMYNNKPTVYSALADNPTTLGTIGFGTTLGNFRINRIFDYHEKVRHSGLRRIVKKYYKQFNYCIQPLLEKRNAERKKVKKMGFQYFEPKWLTNSIHI